MVTAFNVDSYKLLNADPQDRSVELLERISLQLSSFSVNSAFVNSTQPPLPEPTFGPTTTVVAINVLLFLSLALSLITALFAILAHSWIRQYNDLSHCSGAKRAHIRQTRFTALDRWFIPQLIMGLAVILQVALVVFFVGLLMLLWTVNKTVASTILAIAAISLVLYLSLAMIAVFSPTCPYKSPLAWVINAIGCIALTHVAPLLSWLLLRLRILTRTAARQSQPLGHWESFMARMKHRDLYILDAEQYNNNVRKNKSKHIDLTIRAIIWTVQTSSDKLIDFLAPCLLDSEPRPIDALFSWIGHATGESYEENATMEDLANALVRNPGDPLPQQDEMAMTLILHACNHAASEVNQAEFGSMLAGAIFWLKNRRITSDERRWFYLSQLVLLLPDLTQSKFLSQSESLSPIIEFLDYVLQLYVAKPKVSGGTRE